MFIQSPQDAVTLAKIPYERMGDGMHLCFHMQRNAMMFYTKHRHALPTLDQYRQAASVMTELAEVTITPDQAEAILALYPQARIKLAVYGDLQDTDTREAVSFAVAHYFLGCTWPSFGDGVDIDQFMDLLTKQAVAMGYQATH